MNLDDDDVVKAVEFAIQLIINDQPEKAVSELSRIETESILAQHKSRQKLYSGIVAVKSAKQATKRGGLPQNLLDRVFNKSSYTCVYCNRRTIDLRILKLLNKLLPEAVCYNNSWSPKADHLLFWVYSASLEHLTAVSQGGEDQECNMAVACYECNAIKSDKDVGQLGWKVTEVSSDWQGLMNYYDQLNKVVGNDIGNSNREHVSTSVETTFSKILSVSELIAGGVIRTKLPGKRSRRKYHIDSVDKQGMKLTEIWQEDLSTNIVFSKSSHEINIDQLEEMSFELVLENLEVSSKS